MNPTVGGDRIEEEEGREREKEREKERGRERECVFILGTREAVQSLLQQRDRLNSSNGFQQQTVKRKTSSSAPWWPLLPVVPTTAL